MTLRYLEYAWRVRNYFLSLFLILRVLIIIGRFHINGMVINTLQKRIKLLEPPPECPKCYSGAKYFVAHEDGWQCWNCMKIIYQETPIDDLNTDS